MYYSTGFNGHKLEGVCLPGAARLDARNLTLQEHGCKYCDTNGKESQSNCNLSCCWPIFSVEKSREKISTGIRSQTPHLFFR